MTPERPTAETPITSLRPGPNVVFVSLLEQSGKTQGGIILPENQMEAPSQAIVEFVGEIMWSRPGIEFTPKVGQRVLIKRFGHSNQRVNGTLMYAMDIKDILAIVD
jgi:chaperonin GroES